LQFKTKLITIAACAALLFDGHKASAAAVTDKPAAVDAKSAVDSIIEQRMKESGVVGVVAAIIVNKKLVWMQGYGFAENVRAIPFTPNTIMSVGSIAKPFVGVAMMRAVNEAKLSLDADINKYLPFRVVNPHIRMRSSHFGCWQHIAQA